MIDIEDGFSKEIFLNFSDKDLKKFLKILARKEFSRSNKLRFEIIK